MQRFPQLPQISSVISLNDIGVHGRGYLLAIHVGEHQSPPKKSLFHNERSFVIWGPLPSIIFNSVGYLFQDKVPLIELAQAYLLFERVLYPLLIEAPMAHGRLTLTFSKVELVVACLSPL